MSETYTSKIARNSMWATFGFIIASLCNFAMSVAVTRYFGKELYGQYGYFLWLSGVLGIFAGFGFQQTAAKYFPKYFFTEKARTAALFRRLLGIQIAGSLVISTLCVLGVEYFEKLIQFGNPQKPLLLFVTFLSVIPVSLATFLNGAFSAVQEFKKLSRVQIGMSVLNLAAVIGFVLTGQDLVGFLWLYLGLSAVSSLVLLAASRKIFKPSSVKTAAGEKLFSYSVYAYISIICTQIVWERSEVFFLGLFTDSGQIAVYTLAYSLAILFISVWGPLNSVMNAVTSEVVSAEKNDRLHMITRHGTKYLTALIFPLALVASLFLGDVVTFVYGKNFGEVALLFPFLVMAHAVAVVITPAGSIPMLKNEMKKIMAFNIATAALNIILDLYLITRYQAFGAMLANVTSQFFSIGLALINAKKYRLGIFNKYTVRVFLYNTLLAGLFLGISRYDLVPRIAIAGAAAALYVVALLKTALNRQDVLIFSNLERVAPKRIRPALAWISRVIQNNRD